MHIVLFPLFYTTDAVNITDAVNATDTVNITAVRGSSVCLPCTSYLYDVANTVSVTWRRTGSLSILCEYRVQKGGATKKISCEHDINETEQPPRLCLKGVKTRDNGYYNCTVTKIIPPPVISRFYEVKLHIEGTVSIL